MSATVQAQSIPSVSQTTGEPPRKRKKRASAVGAAVDCFTCSNRNLKCDRRRPYCSQCLDSGQDCAGYKTQLTWGVGVASRGKLRGLSLPVAGTAKAVGGDAPPKSKKRRENHVEEPVSPPKNTNISSNNASANSNTAQSSGQFNPPSQTSPITPTQTIYNSQSWLPGHTPFSPTSVQTQRDLEEYKLPPISYHGAEHSLPALQNQLGYSQQQHFFQSNQVSTSTPTYLIHPQTELHQSNTFTEVQPQQYTNHLPADHMSPSDASSNESMLPKTPAFCPPVQKDEPLWQDYKHFDHIDVSDPPQMVPLSGQFNDEEDVEEVNRDYSDECAISDTLSTTSAPVVFNFSSPMMALTGSAGVGKTPRMQYLINYYAEVISPVIVAFDGPNNPFRHEILRMALKSETLQHAISALSASNIRRRQESGTLLSTGKTLPTRRSSMALMALTNEMYQGPVLLSPEEQIREETYHKCVAVQHLNKTLGNQILRQDDAILATLLMLCLFHMCDSGVAKFQAQFAGVKKLLTVRGDELGMLNPEARWMTRMFAWYDAFSATVNDREAQFSSYQADPSAFLGDWSFSNLAGIDGNLFTTISKLGRLNTLAQGKSVTPSAATAAKPIPPLPFSNGLNGQFNGNDWMRILEDEDLFSFKTQIYDLSTQFWQEWREVRQDLQTWTMPYTPSLTPEQALDCENVSEAFRFAALLYTERLANPTLPSHDESIQIWVRKALYFIRLARSDTYLLWPVFVVGAECVEEDGQNVVRQRAIDIQKDSGFVNNASCLDILEKVWAAGATAYETANANMHLSSDTNGFKKSAFIFRDVMLAEKRDGEYFVL